MTKVIRIQLSDGEFRDIERAAQSRGMSVPRFAREALRQAFIELPDPTADERIAAVLSSVDVPALRRTSSLKSLWRMVANASGLLIASPTLGPAGP